MKKVIISTIIGSTLLFTACSFTYQSDADTPNTDDSANTKEPYATGPDPDKGPETMKGPTSPPPVNPAEEAEVNRTHQPVNTTYIDQDGNSHDIQLIFNINEEEIRGILLQPKFEGEKREAYHKLTEQTVFKKISELDVQPVAELPEFSKVYIESLNKAIEMYRDKNPL